MVEISDFPNNQIISYVWLKLGNLIILIFNFLTLGGSLVWTGCDVTMKILPKFQKFYDLSKTGSFVEISQWEPENPGPT